MPRRPFGSAPTVLTIVETLAAVAFGALGLLALLVPQWVEAVFGADPDAGSGAAEWLVVVGAAAAALSATVPARRGWQRRSPVVQA